MKPEVNCESLETRLVWQLMILEGREGAICTIKELEMYSEEGIPLLQHCSVMEDISKTDGSTARKLRLFCYPE